MEVGSDVVEASSSQMVTRQQMKRALDAVMFQVLDNPSMREEILKNVILLEKDAVDRKAACTLRLVGKSLNESVVRILRKAHQHLFKLDDPNRKAVERFVSTFASSTQFMGSVPPLTIRDIGVLCHPENVESFSNCLTRCGDGLIQLGFQTSENGRPFNAELQNWSLPCLHKLDIFLMLNFRDNRSRSDGPGEVAVDDDQNADNLSTCLVKSVLSNVTALSELKLIIGVLYPDSREISEFPVLDSVILPPSLTKITAIIFGPIQHLEILARSPLPNLTSLTMHMASGLFSDGLIIRILENCRKSLKNVILCGSSGNGQPGTHEVTRFPVMEQLVTLFMDGVNVEPELGRDSLDKYFPKLATLHLPTQSTENFQKWTGSSPVPGVSGLRLLLRQNSKASLNVETMQRVNFVFPNLRKLMMAMSSEDSSGLEYIFRELRQLTLLEINVECYLEQNTSSDTWDSLLTGVSVEVIARSRAEPDFWERNELEDENLASIKNLTELRKCTLKLDRVLGGDPYIDVDGQLREPPYPSISDFVFNCALLKMPKLKKFHLGRVSSYNVSEAMTAKWRNEGRSLTFC